MNIAGSDECWEWIAGRHDDGHGMMRWGEGSMRPAHRISYFLEYDEWPEVVMHRCDNPGCVNPKHLEAGTQRENIFDMHRKGRAAPMFYKPRDLWDS